MALDSMVRSKIVRQELDPVLIGQHFGLYSAKVKYLPENIEKPDFFSLCYSTLKKGDKVAILTLKKVKAEDECFEVYYEFIVTDVDKEAKKVDVTMLKKLDLLHLDETVEVEGLDPEVLNAAIDKVVTVKLQNLIKTITELKDTVDNYMTETDDQLEEIENSIKALQDEETEEVTE